MYKSGGQLTLRSDKSLRVYLRTLAKILVSTTEFCRRNKIQSDLTFGVDVHVAVTKFCCGDKDFHKDFPVTNKAILIRREMLLQIFA